MKTKSVFFFAFVLALCVALCVFAAADGISEPLAQFTADTTVESAKTDLRFVFAVDSLEYDEVGFIVSYYPMANIDFSSVKSQQVQSGLHFATVNGHRVLKISTSTVYTSIIAGGKQVLASELGGNYIAVFRMNNINNSQFDRIIHVMSYSVKNGQTAYSAEKLMTVRSLVRGISFDRMTAQNLILVATYTNNSRLSNPASTAAAQSEAELATVPLGTSASAAGVQTNIKTYTFAGDTSQFNPLVGLPVTVYRMRNTVYGVEAYGNTISGYASDFTAGTGNSGYFKGQSITLASSLAASGSANAWSQAHSGSWSVYATTPRIFGNRLDEIYTLVDTDFDGQYDFFRENRVINGLQLDLGLCEEGVGVVFQGCGYGSAEYTGWLNSGNKLPYTLCGSLAGKTLAEVGDTFLDVFLIRDNAAGVKEVGTVYARCEIWPATVVVGTLESCTHNSTTDITMVVGSKEYRWTNFISTNTDCDNSNGNSAGRTVAKYYPVGSQVALVLDRGGNVVQSELVIPKGPVQILAAPNGTQASALFDIQAYWNYRIPTKTVLRTYVQALYNMDIRCVYMVTSNPGYPQYSNNAVGYSTRSNFKKITDRFKRMGYDYPDFALAEMCHEYGMKCYAVYKPYEGGGMENIPFDQAYDSGFTAFNGYGGLTVQLDSFLTENLKNGIDYRIIRRPDGVNSQTGGTIDKVTVDFVTSSYTIPQKIDYNVKSYVGAISSSSVSAIANGNTYTRTSQHPSYGINVWVSDSNGNYTEYTGNYSYRYVTGSKQLYDANGDAQLGGQTFDTITLEITGLSIEESFVAVSFVNTYNLRTNPLAYMHLYSGSREIVSSNTAYIRRHTVGDVWGRDSTPMSSVSCTSVRVNNGKITASCSDSARKTIVENFIYNGFAFNFEPYGDFIESNVGVICAGRGREETFPGGYCEAYPEVREFWMSHMQELMNSYFDGVVIRLQSHSSIATDFKNYGYNEPIVQRYKELYGQSAYNTLMNPSHTITDEEYIRIMRIRGDFFTMFLDEAVELCHENGKEFAVCLRDSYTDAQPVISASQDEVTWWTMPKVLPEWRHIVDISDFVVIKDYVRSASEVATNGKAIRQYAHAQNKKVWIECYDSQAGVMNANYMRAVVNQTDIDGFIVYEASNIENYIGRLPQELKAAGFRLETVEESD